MNQYQLDFIEDPPPKNPYFTLPDTQFFVSKEEAKILDKLRPTSGSLVVLFGSFDRMSDDQQTKFLLTLIKYSGFVPDFDAMASALNLSNAHHVRRRFIAIAERQGFDVEGDNIKMAEGIATLSGKEKSASKAATASCRKLAAATKSTLDSNGTVGLAKDTSSDKVSSSPVHLQKHTTPVSTDVAEMADCEDNVN